MSSSVIFLILKRGIEIDHHKSHKDRGYDSWTFSAPVTINGKKGFVGVVVRKTGKYRYKTHRIVATDGSEFILIKEDAEAKNLGFAIKTNDSKGSNITSASKEIITQKGKDVKSLDYDDTSSIKYAIDDEFDISDIDIKTLRTIGRKSINDFTSEDIQKSEKWTRKFYKELGTKSPFFRAWFGDWRSNDNKEIEVANIRDDDRGLQLNEDTGWYINVSGKVFNETKSHNAIGNKGAIQYLPYIKDIVNKAILLDTYCLDKPKSLSSLFMHSFYAVADLGNGAEVLKLYVEEINDPNSHNSLKRAYQLQNIEKAFTASVRVQGNTSSSLTNTVNAINNVSDLFSLVKQYDKNFNPKPVNPLMLNDDGTPKVFYHGTPNGTFNIFKDWQYFTDNRNYADIYQSQGASSNGYKPIANNTKTYGVYLTGKKIFDTRKPECRKIFMNEFYQKWGNGAPLSDRGLPDWTDGDDFIEFFEENDYDYDVLLLDEGATGGYGAEVNDRGISYVVKNSNQIKSATDNIGTFDGNNPDIRYAIDDEYGMFDDLLEGETEEQKAERWHEEFEKYLKYNPEQALLMTYNAGAKTAEQAIKVYDTALDEKRVDRTIRKVWEQYHISANSEKLAFSDFKKALNEYVADVREGKISYGESFENLVMACRDSLQLSALEDHNYDDFRAELKAVCKNGLVLNKYEESEIKEIYGSVARYRNALFGKCTVRLERNINSAGGNKTGQYIDDIIADLINKFGDMVPVDMHSFEGLQWFEQLVNKYWQPQYINPYIDGYSEDINTAAIQMAYDV